MSFLVVLALVLTASSYDQLEIYKFSQDISEPIQSNSPCIWQISKSYVTVDIQSGKSPSMALALEQGCNDGYEITLIDAEHIETITISKTVPVQISGKNTTSGKRMIIGGGSENSGEGEYIIRIDSASTGDIIVQNIKMREWNGGLIRCDGGKSVTLRENVLIGGGSIVHNTDGILDISNCEFIGDGLNVPIDSFITVMKGSINIINSYFSKGQFKGKSDGCIVCCETSTSCTIESCEFTENKYDIGASAVSITTKTCQMLTIKGTSNKRTIFYGLDSNNTFNGHFIKTVSSKISISYSDFTDAIFTNNGKAITIDEYQAFQIRSAITVQSQSSDNSGIRYLRFSECIFANNKGNIQYGAVTVDI
ncbi:MAG: hypothetical protein EZS28_009141 [Streblomastix strix]|uniref:Right handed beta helix domain-containing protein n=1 Tax=Streblomastix strix TaxID=222440 RepID=A0A5J4WKI9_9EUKA|nr:MAG: hypothetical protein EZS28_009141 [Streblomastix strix]